MANPITKILHFAEEIQNVHPAGSPIEVTECDPTPTPTQEELPSSISPSMWTDDEMLAQFNSSALPKYCAISMYAKDGKYYIASGTNKVGEPQSFEKAPIINWNLCDDCVNQDHTQVFLSINVYENEEAKSCLCR